MSIEVNVTVSPAFYVSRPTLGSATPGLGSFQAWQEVIAEVEAGRQRIHQSELFPCVTQGNREISSFASSVRACNLKARPLPVGMQPGVLL